MNSSKGGHVEKSKRTGGAGDSGFFRRYGILVIFCLLGIGISVVTPNFLTSQNIMNILRQSSIVGLIAIGTMTIIRGLTYIYTGGYPIIGESEGFRGIGSGYAWGVPVPVIILIVVGIDSYSRKAERR